MPSAVSRSRIASLSWAKTSASGVGCMHDAGVGQGREHVGRDVLVVEGHDVALAGEGEHRLDVAVRARPAPTG